jgi:hypothetical protein
MLTGTWTWKRLSMRNVRSYYGLVVLLCGLLAWRVASTQAQQAPGYFLINPQPDQLSGAPDFSFLNRPITPAERVFARDGHFYRVGADLQPNTGDDERVRFWGVNLAFNANFPDLQDAPRVARRLRKLGVNLVRLHHMDSSPDSSAAGNSLLTTGPYPTLNQSAVTRLRAFLDALKAEGIYANLNLKVGYVFRPSMDNVPALPNNQPFPSQSKPLQMIHPRLIELQQEFARKTLEALQLGDDPVLALIEINNESSIIYDWQRNALDDLVRGEYRDVLQQQWNGFLKTKYASTEDLREAWGGETEDGPELLSPSGQPQGNLTGWVLELHGAARATFDYVDGAPTPTARVNITDGSNWVIFRQIGFTVPLTDRPFLAECEIRADLPDGQTHNASMTVMRHAPPWDNQFSRSITVTNQWQKVSASFIPRAEYIGTGRFSFNLEGLAGTNVYLRNWSLRQAARRGLAADQSLEAGNVALVGSNEVATTARVNDYALFLADRDRAYLRAMLGAIRAHVAPPVPVTGTQMGFGGLMTLDTHAEMDYLDDHYYVDHYGFPNMAWDNRDWYVRNLSHVGGGLASLLEVASKREAGRPFTVSEFNQNWPNIYAAEHDPVVAAVAALQDWDGLMHFAFSHDRNWDAGVPRGFDLNGDWTKWAGFGQAAWLYRSGALESANQTVELPLSADFRLRALREKRNWEVRNFLNTALGYNPALALVHQVRLARDDERPVPAAAKEQLPQPYAADTGEFSYDQPNRRFLLHAARAAGVIGFFNNQKVTAGALDVELGANSRGFAAVLLTALDEQPLPESKRMLLSLPGNVLRTQPGASPARPQQLVNYPNRTDWWTLEREPNFPNKPSGNRSGGNTPVWMERVECNVTLRTNARQITVYPLDGAGGRRAALPASEVETTDRGFRLRLQTSEENAAFWYEIVTDAEVSVAHVSAANYRGERLARDSIVAAFGAGLATKTEAASGTPLPTQLAGTRVSLKDSAGRQRDAALFFVSPNQVNYLLPADAAVGTATITITSGDGTRSLRTAQITSIAPGLFTANGNGQGVPAAVALRVRADGAQSYELVAVFDAAQNLSFVKTRSACIFNEFLKPPAARSDDAILRLQRSRSLIHTLVVAWLSVPAHPWRATNVFGNDGNS